ncbi:MAG: alkane 1-monooxygenase [Thermoleophilaceae bacterium]|nr:alkane 1-monooxygenase [Thermoleophilaceae bacterium]
MPPTATPEFPSAEHHHHDHDDNPVELNQPETWHDPKRYAWLLGLIIPCAPFIAWALVELTGLGFFWYGGPLIVFVAFPIFDQLIGTDSENPPDSVLAWLEADKYYRYVVFAYIPLQYAGLVFACWQWAYGGLSGLESLGLALTMGTVSGIAINTAHELGHKREQSEKWLSKVALAQTFYGHFFIEHNRGHHVRVSTPEDPASSRFGENFYEFWPRTVWGSLKSAIEIENKRLARTGDGFWTWKNDLLQAWAMSVVLYVGLTAIFGWVVLPYLIIQGIMGFSLLEVVNYLEHYGLLRDTKDDGRYERCQPSHSWNSNQIASNVFLYHLQRHSDHHAHPTRRYQALRNFEEAPDLPSGYATMIVTALFPPVWRRVMDKRVLAHYDGDISRANILPRKRDRILKRYGGDKGGQSSGGQPSGGPQQPATAGV